MKTVMKLSAILPQFDKAMQDAIAASLKSAGLSVEDAQLKRAGIRDEDMKLEDGSRACIHRVSTRDPDRSGDVMIQQGIDLTDYRKNPVVMWAHNYREPQIGSDEWIKVDDNGYSLVAKTVYASTPRAQEVWTLRKEGHLKTSSIGFIPVEIVRGDDKGFLKMADQCTADWPEFKKQRDRVRCFIKRALLLEHSDVPIPDNQNALTLAVAKSLNLSDDMIAALDLPGEGSDDGLPVIKLTPELVAQLMGIRPEAVTQKAFQDWLTEKAKAPQTVLPPITPKSDPMVPGSGIRVVGFETPAIKVVSLPGGIRVLTEKTISENCKNLLDLKLGRV